MANLRRRSFLASITGCLTGLAVRRASPLGLLAGVGLSQSAKPSASVSMSSSNARTRPDGQALDRNSPKAGSFWFTDVARRSQFAYRTNNNFTGRKYFPQPMCGGVAVIDYNNDGLMDL